MSYRRLVTVLLLATAVINPAASQERSMAHGVAYTVTPGSGSDTSLKEIIAKTIGVQLTRRRTTIEELGPTDTTTLSSLISAAAVMNAQYLLSASYTTTASDIALVLHIYDVETAKEVGGTTANGRIDLSMDTLVAQAIDKAVRGLEFRQAPTTIQAAGLPEAHAAEAAQAAAPPAEQTAQAATPPAEQTAAPVAAQSAPPAPDQPAAPPAGPPVAQPAAQPEPLPAPQPSAPSSPKRGATFGLSLGAAPFFLIGPAGPYATIGGLAILGADFRFPLGPGTLSLGILSGALFMRATGAVTEANVTTVPIGVEALYTLNDGGFPGIALRLSGGPAIMNVVTAYAGSLTKVIPYALAGMILELPFASWIGLSIEVQWAAYFESMSFLIMGFAPEVSFYVRF